MPTQDFIIPGDGALSTVLYTNNSYLWWMTLLFLVATLVVIYMILGVHTRKMRQDIKAEAEEGESVPTSETPLSDTESERGTAA